MEIKSLLKQWIPPAVAQMFRSAPLVRWKDKYTDWDQAAAKTKGYDDRDILEKVSTAVQKVNSGLYPYERDGFLFDEPQYNWPFLASLGLVKASMEHKLNVVDFGGSLGSSFISNKALIESMINRWDVIEQQHFVQEGAGLSLHPSLRFYTHAKDRSELRCDLLIFSSVLQYLEHPLALAENLLDQLRPAYILIDRTPVTDKYSFITTQQVFGTVPSSYPLRIFNNKELTAHFENRGFSKHFEFNSFCDPQNYKIEDAIVSWSGCLLSKR